MIYTIIAAVVFFLIVILTLVSVLLFAKAKLLPSGEVTLTINGKENITINPGGTILGTLGDNKIFLPSACGGGGTCVQCTCQVHSGGGTILPTEEPHFSRKKIADNWRLGCQVKVKEDMDIHIPEEVFGVKKWEATVVSNYNVATYIKEFVVEVPENMPLMPSTIPVGIPAEILSRRPDIVAAEQNLNAAGANFQQAKASLYPQISLTSSTGTSTSELSDLVSGDSLIWNIGVNIVQPLFQGGRLRQNVKIQQANLKAAESNFRSVFINALNEVENALDAEVQLEIMDTSLEEANKQSKAAANIAQERYDQGLENIITLLEARRRSIEAESRWWLIRRQRIDNRINLHLALGGGFEPTKDYTSNY